MAKGRPWSGQGCKGQAGGQLGGITWLGIQVFTPRRVFCLERWWGSLRAAGPGACILLPRLWSSAHIQPALCGHALCGPQVSSLGEGRPTGSNDAAISSRWKSRGN